ncbi:MAG: ATP-dependent 6-phosphofructokinase [Candidatus Margulisiibacteriota bacterium]|nr:MAG: diphosphate--fructose-6-phosphate 1-phosphotransferase [Candidatus Margulisbacteria bacterium GWD2_39_127]PZM84846.1 MAG: ATP-dependent 6-phosphofructokinase [Candidatus Margulisiibacteriota bacterium]HAR63281.1 ATP-dependent 6-phosphofructokinase [Candidatus Margulisiibacteriota bacterium]HCY36349.1 ATP-dependent 6-phosphofructokinase [Candidatus Margulisiibacteriota bacterium]
MLDHFDFSIPSLGVPRINSPILFSNNSGDNEADFVNDDDFIIYNITAKADDHSKAYRKDNLLEQAGPREKIYFNPGHVHAGIVTCGGLCPGLNDVIRAIVRGLWYRYGVRRVTGIRFGFRGFLPEYNLSTMDLNPHIVKDIHQMGGTILGSSRGGGDRINDIVDAIERLNINMLFTIGGDGTQRGALFIAEELERRGLKIAVVGIPKTIDNDLSFVQQSFGFETAVAKAVEAVSSAHIEADSAINGIGVVKVMGRESGFIAAYTALAMNDVNFVLIPEVPFDIEGDNGLLSLLKKRVEARNHAVVLVAEGAGQGLLEQTNDKDESGNKKLGDIGIFLKKKIIDYFKSQNIEINLKYIDPSYIIRSAPAIPSDSLYCARLGSHAVHAAMAGKTKILISQVNNCFVHIPIKLAVLQRNYVNPESSLWRDVLEATRQPILMKNKV